ncbi:MAG: enoyl-CoA hydratase/isomerase family protein [Pseudomonadales bacterium]|nr:enoyl-CoA hydratase/isomerase family protein [Pseudomonadales bacterium]
MQTGQFTGFEVSLTEPGIAWIEFNEPEKLNGMSSAKKRDLIETLTQAQMDNRVRVVVFIGQGRGFCAGDDLKAYSHAQQETNALVPPIFPGHDSGIGTYDGLRIISQGLNRAIRDLDKLTIAAINGIAIQTGLSLALACDFKIAAEEARLGSATLRFGLLPDEGGQYLLLQHLGLTRTLDFVMRKRIVSAAEALEMGLVNDVVPGDELRSAVTALATELANGPQVSMRLLKRSVYQAAELTFEQACDEIAAKTAISDHHPDAREGVAAFREKRTPKFNAWLEEKK